jgi:hypothetical protein
MNAWLCELACLLPEHQSGMIALSFVDGSYTSLEVLLEEDPQRLLQLPRIKGLQRGAFVAYSKKLTGIKVCICFSG